MLIRMTAATREALGKRIKELRKANNLTQQKLALMVNIERGYLAKIEGGSRNPTVDCLEKLADGFDITLSELFEGVDNHRIEERMTPVPLVPATKETVNRSYRVAKLPQ